jgi:hypothetical protein
VYALPGDRIGGIDLARLGDAGVRLAGPRRMAGSGTTLSVSPADRSLAIVGGIDSTAVLRLRDPAPAPPAAPSAAAACAGSRDFELLVDGSPSMSAAVTYVRTAIEAMVSKPRSTPINVGAITIGRRSREVFPPLSLAPEGFADDRDLGTLRLLLDEHVAADAGAPDYAQALDVAVAARRAATALVLITDAAERQPPTPLRSPGRPVHVVQLGDGRPPARGVLEDLAKRSGGRYYPNQDATTLPEVLAAVEAGLTCDHPLETAVTSRPVSAKVVGPKPAQPFVARATLTPQFTDRTIEAQLLPETRTATLSVSFKAGARGARVRPGACVRTRGVVLESLRVISGRRVVARLGERGLRRALTGRMTPFGGVLSATGRCGRGFLVVEVAGLERLAGPEARAAANSPRRRARLRIKLDKPPMKRAVAGGGTGSSKSKRGRR